MIISNCSTYTSVFEIDEILRLFLSFCDKPTLARLARTSSLFSELALDLLWEELESFTHLLRLFPDELITWHVAEGSNQFRPTVNHLIVPRDWKRFTRYSRRIKRWVQEDLSYIDEPVVDHIAFGRLPEYILPRLTHMEVMATSVSGLHLQTLILCPTLESVTIWNNAPLLSATRQMNTFFRTLADRATKLQKLIVHWGDGTTLPSSFTDGLADVFSLRQPELQTVHLWSPLSVDARTFSLLAQLPNLTTLHLNLIGILDAHVLCADAPRSDTFPSLQNIYLAGAVEEFHKTLRYFGNSRKTISLGFSVREYPKAKSLHHLFSAVAVNFPYLRILQFNVPKEEINADTANASYSRSTDQYYHDISVLRPLLALRTLAAAHIEIGVPLHLTDTDLRTIGASWPNIEVLNLCSDPFCERTRTVRPEPTICGVFELATQCKMLQRLGLYVDYSTHLSEDLVATCDLVSHSVVDLDVGRSWIIQPEIVAAVLSGLFPRLKVFQWQGMEDPDSWIELSGGHSPGWRRVYDMLSVFRAVRVNEARGRASREPVEVNTMIVD